MATLSESLYNIGLILSNAGLDDAVRETEFIFAHILGMKPTELSLHRNDILPDSVVAEADAVARRRATHEPLQYIIGEWDFYGLTLKLTQDVLIPRSETERLVELVMRLKPDAKRGLEIGVGSGAISLALLSENPSLTRLATEISPRAALLAEENAEILGLSDRLDIVVGDIIAPLSNDARFDFVVSNPPYIDPALAPVLQEELSYEPHNALFADDSGFSVIEKIIASLPKHIISGGFAAIEIAEYHRKRIERFCGPNVRFYSDLSGKIRYAVIEKTTPSAT